MLGPELFLLHQVLTIFNETGDQLEIRIPVVFWVYHRTVGRYLLVWIVQGLPEGASRNILGLLRIHYDRRLYTHVRIIILHMLLLLVLVYPFL